MTEPEFKTFPQYHLTKKNSQKPTSLGRLMEIRHFQTHEDFELFVQELRQGRTVDNPQPGQASQLLFRGQSNAEWGLETTLERRAPNRQLFFHYLELAWQAHKPFEAFTGQRWHLPDISELHSWQRYDPHQSIEGNLASIGDYLVFLRHHGFPSPLLDWSESEFVAEFFAFEPNSNADRAVYIYQQTANGVTPYPDRMIRTAPWLRSATSRHFIQHCTFTISTDYHKEYGWQFIPHETVIAEYKGTNNHRLWKCIIADSDRRRAMKKLDAHSLNAFSLYATTDALASALSVRFIDIR